GGQVARRRLGLVHAGDLRGRRAFVEQGAEPVEGLERAGGHHLDGPVGHVADGAAESELAGRPIRPHAEADALDAAVDAEGAAGFGQFWHFGSGVGGVSGPLWRAGPAAGATGKAGREWRPAFGLWPGRVALCPELLPELPGLAAEPAPVLFQSVDGLVRPQVRFADLVDGAPRHERAEEDEHRADDQGAGPVGAVERHPDQEDQAGGEGEPADEGDASPEGCAEGAVGDLADVLLDLQLGQVDLLADEIDAVLSEVPDQVADRGLGAGHGPLFAVPPSLDCHRCTSRSWTRALPPRPPRVCLAAGRVAPASAPRTAGWPGPGQPGAPPYPRGCNGYAT